MSGNVRLAISVAKRFSARVKHTPSMGFEDLVQEGCLGLHRAAQKYDPESGYAFSTYAYWWITQAITRKIEIHSKVIRSSIDSQMIERRWRYKPHDQSLDEFCQQWGYKKKRVLADLQQSAICNAISLDAKAKNTDDGSKIGRASCRERV